MTAPHTSRLRRPQPGKEELTPGNLRPSPVAGGCPDPHLTSQPFGRRLLGPGFPEGGPGQVHRCPLRPGGEHRGTGGGGPSASATAIPPLPGPHPGGRGAGRAAEGRAWPREATRPRSVPPPPGSSEAVPRRLGQVPPPCPPSDGRDSCPSWATAVRFICSSLGASKVPTGAPGPQLGAHGTPGAVRTTRGAGQLTGAADGGGKAKGCSEILAWEPLCEPLVPPAGRSSDSPGTVLSWGSGPGRGSPPSSSVAATRPGRGPTPLFRPPRTRVLSSSPLPPRPRSLPAIPSTLGLRSSLPGQPPSLAGH